jgi:hypothetical protein
VGNAHHDGGIWRVCTTLEVPVPGLEDSFQEMICAGEYFVFGAAERASCCSRRGRDALKCKWILQACPELQMLETTFFKGI